MQEQSNCYMLQSQEFSKANWKSSSISIDFRLEFASNGNGREICLVYQGLEKNLWELVLEQPKEREGFGQHGS